MAVLRIDSTMDLCYSRQSFSRQSLHFCQNSLFDSLSSQLKERCSTEAQSSGAGHTLTYTFTLVTFVFSVINVEIKKMQFHQNFFLSVNSCYNK